MATEVKVCGVIEPESAVAAAELGARYLGLNFYPHSPRYVALDQARAIADALGTRRDRPELVGVFVDAAPRTIEEAIEIVGLDWVQLSGDEPPEAVLPFAARTVKAFRGGALPAAAALVPYGPLWGVLIDAPHSTLFGGTGEAWDYSRLAGWQPGSSRWKLFLAGGLGPDNVRRAVQSLRPDVVDVCSRIESAPGIKDRASMQRFFEEVKLGSISTAA
jgi:phosphoribosylanthranilate isomerase